MVTHLSPPRVVLLAVHLASKSDIAGLTSLAAEHSSVLHRQLLLRILLTCLPETLETSQYVPLVERIESNSFPDEDPQEVDTTSIDDISDEEATHKVRKLRLLPLKWNGAPEDALEDPIALFLIHRAHRVDNEAGLLTQLPALAVPFLDHAPCIRTWVISSLLPLLRRNYEYYPNSPTPHTLSSFEQLSPSAAVELLLSETGAQEGGLGSVGRDLRGLIGPWLYNNAHWARERGESDGSMTCPGWEQVLEWLTLQAANSWKVAVSAVDQWDGPDDVDLAGYGNLWFGDDEREYLERRWARAVLASAYLVPESSIDALAGVNTMITKVMNLLDQDPSPTLQVASSMLSPYMDQKEDRLLCLKNATYMRNDLLDDSNPLTAPTESATQLLHFLTLSAFILTKSGVPCTVRRAGELAFLQDEREQKEEAVKLIQSLGKGGPKSDDKYWIRARNELLWLRDWGAEEDSGSPHTPIQGVFGRLEKEFIEVECLKVFLANTRYSLARAIYEESPEKPLDSGILQDTVISAAMSAYDNATNPHRGRGGMLKCYDIIHAFPVTVAEMSPEATRIESLLRATHALSEYRLVLKQGEPFTPVVLRVHSDPISIIGKVLEQNRRSYTKIQDFVEIGANMVKAGLTGRDKSSQKTVTTNQLPRVISNAEKRVTSMCIDAALTEDDFETAYSYVVNRLASGSDSVSDADDYSWKAALQAGRYRRTEKTLRPTHIGTASGNLDIRHLEQRIECLSTALRVAPAATLQEILTAFRKCEEELHAAIKAEEALEDAFDEQGDKIKMQDDVMPGAFSSTIPAGVMRGNKVARGASGAGGAGAAEEAPMSLFDLSRASMTRAQRNFSALSSLQHTRQDVASGATRPDGDEGDDDEHGHDRVRRRDQFREAAVGTLASGVGWLIGAQPTDRAEGR